MPDTPGAGGPPIALDLRTASDWQAGDKPPGIDIVI